MQKMVRGRSSRLKIAPAKEAAPNPNPNPNLNPNPYLNHNPHPHPHPHPHTHPNRKPTPHPKAAAAAKILRMRDSPRDERLPTPSLDERLAVGVCRLSPAQQRGSYPLSSCQRGGDLILTRALSLSPSPSPSLSPSPPPLTQL